MQSPQNNQTDLNQHFLEEIFAQLLHKKQMTPQSKHNIPIGTVYPGFKTIPIQKLDLKQKFQGQNINGQDLWYKDLVKRIQFYRQSCPLSFRHQNGFFKAFYQAYVQHGQVKITPDDVWLTIMIYFSKYVDNNAKKLRKAFVNYEGKMLLDVCSQSINWQEFLDRIIVNIRKNIVEGVTEQLECNFSSTDKFSRFFSTVAIMNAYQKYFDYRFMICVCGITSIHMGGTLEDWQKLCKKLENLSQFDVDGRLKEYVNRLLPVLDQFVETYKGNAHIQFWNNIYHQRKNPHQRAYQPSLYINGWIIRFFTTYDRLGDKVALEEIQVPVTLFNLLTKEEKQLYFVGGCRGVSVQQGKVYRPHFSFAVAQKRKAPSLLR